MTWYTQPTADSSCFLVSIHIFSITSVTLFRTWDPSVTIQLSFPSQQTQATYPQVESEAMISRCISDRQQQLWRRCPQYSQDQPPPASTLPHPFHTTNNAVAQFTSLIHVSAMQLSDAHSCGPCGIDGEHIKWWFTHRGIVIHILRIR